MTSIQKRDNGKWRARYRDASGREHARHFDRRADAARWVRDQSGKVDRGDWADPALGRVTVGEWGATWLAGQHQLTPSTRQRYDVSLRNQVLPTWAAVQLADVTHSGVSAWVSALVASGLSASTTRHAHRILSRLLAAAVRDGRLTRNPADGVGLPRAASVEKRFLTAAQVATLAHEAGSSGLTIRVLAYTGLRFGELVALRVSDVDLMRRRLEVRASATEVAGRLVYGEPKTHQRRSVPLVRSLVDELAGQCAGRAPGDAVFYAPGGGPLRLNNFRRRVFDPAAGRAGLEGLTPHELRHTAASLAVSSGANVKAVQRMLGHASASMTLDTYSGLFDDDLDGLADRMDAVAVRAAADWLRTGGEVVQLPDRS